MLELCQQGHVVPVKDPDAWLVKLHPVVGLQRNFIPSIEDGATVAFVVPSPLLTDQVWSLKQ